MLRMLRSFDRCKYMNVCKLLNLCMFVVEKLRDNPDPDLDRVMIQIQSSDVDPDREMIEI